MRIFWILAFVIAWAITVPIAIEQLDLAKLGGWPPQLAFLIGFAPAIAAIIAALMHGEGRQLWDNASRFRAAPWLFAVAIVAPFGFIVAPWLVGTEIAAPPGAAFFAIVWLVLAFGEELGWRGYALPRLVAAHGFWAGSTILGLVWCVWHYPRLYASPYIESFAQGLPWIGLFSIQIVLANYILCWLAIRARYAVIVPTLFHAAFNFAATLHAQAATDPIVTAAVGLGVLAIWVFDRAPQAPEARD